MENQYQQSLNSLFLRVKDILDRSLEMENGSISHLKVFTAVAFTLFAQVNVDIAVVEVVLEGSFKPHIKSILHDKAASMGSPIVSASSPGNRSSIKDSRALKQTTENDIKFVIFSLMLRKTYGWLENIQCIHSCWFGACVFEWKSQFLTPEEAEAVGLAGATILVDGGVDFIPFNCYFNHPIEESPRSPILHTKVLW